MTALAALLLRPPLWPTALVEFTRFVPGGWWRRAPFIPLPHKGLASFRVETMYGDAKTAPSAGDLIVWLQWCRAQNRRARP